MKAKRKFIIILFISFISWKEKLRVKKVYVMQPIWDHKSVHIKPSLSISFFYPYCLTCIFPRCSMQMGEWLLQFPVGQE